ncbi:MAG: xanthine dehydrogenase family protein molybdopterin-binding subunit [Myxococcota bacterium]
MPRKPSAPKAAGTKRTVQVGFADQTKSISVKLPDDEATPWDASSSLEVVGKRIPRIDGRLKVSGKAKYTFDVAVPGMFWAAVPRSPHPAAVIESIDVSAAEGQRGVQAVIAVAKKGDRMIFAGQDVAAVAAERPEQAREALHHIVVKYKDEPYVVETMEAAAAAAPTVHKAAVRKRKTEGDEPGAEGKSRVAGNVNAHEPSVKGNVERALSKADAVIEGTYTTPVQTHSALETHGLMVRWDDDKHLTVWASTQGIFSVRDDLAQMLELPAENISVVTDFLGGGFGAKFGAGAPGSALGSIAAQLAKKTGAPVKLMCDRHDEQVCTGNRPDSHQVVKLGARKGKLVAIDVTSHGSGGIATGAGVGRNASNIYTKCPNIRVAQHDVFTNAGPATAMRAPGHPQGAFALELAIDELAAKAGVDPLDMRIANDEHPVRLAQYATGRQKFGWDEARKNAKAMRERGARVRRGYGVAASIWGDFGRPSAAVATARVSTDGTIAIENGVQDIGGGIPTILAQIAAEVFGRPLETIKVRWGHSKYGASVGSGGSQTTSSVTPAARNALERARAQLAAHAAKQLGAETAADVTWDADGTAHAGDKSMTFVKLCAKLPGEGIVATGTRPPTYGNHPRPFLGGAPMLEIGGVQFAEVEVDTWTGVVVAKRVLALHDCGRVMNRMTTESQVNGGVILGTSYALMEQRVMDNDFGRMLNPNLESYKILGAKDTPEIEVDLMDVHAGNNNTGAAGIGEPSTIPTAAAIACAVFDAVGSPVRSLPLTPNRVLAALGKVPGGAR